MVNGPLVNDKAIILLIMNSLVVHILAMNLSKSFDQY